MTASPFASPPIASRRSGAAFRRATPRSLFRYAKSGKVRRAALDAPSSAGSLSFRISTAFSIYEKPLARGKGALKIGRQDQRNSAISTSDAATILVRGRDLVGELVGAISFTE